MISNGPQISRQIDLYANRVREAGVQYFREQVWETFLRILRNTPQYSGKGVAHWNLGIGQPEPFQDLNLGDDPDEIVAQGATFDSLRKRGDRKWINIAIKRNRPNLALITRSTKVYFTNEATGDGPNDPDGFAYIAELQDKGFALSKLRGVNQPYETALESALIVAAQRRKTLGGRLQKVLRIKGTFEESV